MSHLELVQPAPLQATPPRVDHEIIASMLGEGQRVLDIGCGDGSLIAHLATERGVRARGIEINPAKVHQCVRRGLAVVQGDAERDLGDIPSGAFDYVIFSQSLQELRRPQDAMRQAARIGERIIVSVRNSAQWRARTRLLTKGLLSTPFGEQSAHPTTIRDFAGFARSMRLNVERAVPITRGNPGAPFAKVLWRANWFADEAIFLLTT
jgi:methionine biosynthesis protein MetW